MFSKVKREVNRILKGKLVDAEKKFVAGQKAIAQEAAIKEKELLREIVNELLK